jgi:hypothetical protein
MPAEDWEEFHAWLMEWSIKRGEEAQITEALLYVHKVGMKRLRKKERKRKP